MRLKPGVKLAGVKTEIMFAVLVADQVYREVGKDVVITSVTDGTHSANSLHYKGLAVDLRTSYLTEQEKKFAVEQLKVRLGAEFDVVLESTHIHIEFDPKE